MSIVNSMERVRAWLEENVCSQVKLKAPDDSATDAAYPYELIHPAAFAMFLPSKDRMPPPVRSPIPSVCVQLVQGEDNLTQCRRGLVLRLSFSAWDPGLHGQDVFLPKGGGRYEQRQEAAFQKNAEGWRDVWNFVDTAMRLLEDCEYPGGLRIMKERGITFGPFTEQDAVPDFYPYWYAWVQFTLEEGLTRHPTSYHELL